MNQPPETSRLNRPLTSGQQYRLQLAARRLGELLIEAAPLINLLNASATPHRYRAAFTQVVGMRRFAMVFSGLRAMSCRSAWEHFHPQPAQPDTP